MRSVLPSRGKQWADSVERGNISCAAPGCFRTVGIIRKGKEEVGHI